MQPHPLERLLAPRAVAVVGDAAEGSVAAHVLRNLVAGGFAGEIHAIASGAAPLPAGVARRGSLAEVDGELDLAVLAAPFGELVPWVRACAERRVAGAVIPAGVPGAEERGGLSDEVARALAAEAARGGLRLVGPNSVGLLRPGAGVDASFTLGGARPGSLGLVSQSGAICAAALDWAAGHPLGFSAVVSLGDALDLDFGDVLEYLALDAATRSILLYVERVRAARPFLSGLRLAARLKPVVVVKAGRHGAPAASDDAFDAALARTGAVRVSSIEGMFAAASLLATPRPVSGNRLAVVTNARGPGLLAADRAADLGVRVGPLAEATRAALDAALPAVGSHANPVDLLGDAPPARFGAAVRLCLADPGVDGVLALLAPHAPARPLESADAVVAASRGQGKPVVACFMGGPLVREAHDRLVGAGVPAFSAPEGAVEAFAILASYARSQRLLRQLPGPLSPDAMPRLDLAREVVRGALERGRAALTTAELRRLLAVAGVRDRAAAGQRVRGAELFVEVARDAVFGPVIRFGRGRARAAGGGDAVAALPPLDTAIVQTIVRTSRLAGAFTAAGGMGAPEAAAFERVLWAVSELVSEVPELRELEIAPLVVSGGEAYASEARAAVGPAGAGAGRYGHMAIHPYPSDVGARFTLDDGAVVTVRPIRPEDAEGEASFVRGLSDEARHFRFMTGLKELTHEMLVRFTQIDYERELALVALAGQGGAERQIAVARYVKTDPSSADVAVVVADAWQGRGIGRRLLEMLLDAARARGVRRLGGEVLAENAAMRALLASLGFTLRRDPDGGDVLLIEKVL